ncbi:MAG: SpoIVB peptidase [Oscillospiraceae bacterium]|nr:SpoIVB peptidase [Oscillospiraceae bacterium]
MTVKRKLPRMLAAAAALVVTLSCQSVLAAEGMTLVPVGQTVGMKIDTDGIIVSDISSVQTEKGEAFPARDAGIKKGDIIIKADGADVTCASELSALISESCGREVRITLLRGGEEREAILVPVKSCADGVYKAGLWIRDSIAGIGTVTYYDPDTGAYGALGHGVSDCDAGTLMPVEGGNIVCGTVTGVQKGEKGEPGMLKGKFLPDETLGTIEINTTRGVFGKMDPAGAEKLAFPMEEEEVAEPHVGSATIISNVDGCRSRHYDVQIQAVYPDAEERNMLITVTDCELIDLTGGIVQGMSGSPVIQDGKLVGAVTHVLINEPLSGYGISIENMLAAAA